MLPWERDLDPLDLNITSLPGHGLHWADHALVSAIVATANTYRHIAGECQASSTPAIAGGPLLTASHDRSQRIGHFVLGAAVSTPIKGHDLRKPAAGL